MKYLLKAVSREQYVKYPFGMLVPASKFTTRDDAWRFPTRDAAERDRFEDETIVEVDE